jgi:hypothetical protein
MLSHVFGGMARLVSAIGVFLTAPTLRIGANVDARDKRGHDGEEALPSPRVLGIQRGGD